MGVTQKNMSQLEALNVAIEALSKVNVAFRNLPEPATMILSRAWCMLDVHLNRLMAEIGMYGDSWKPEDADTERLRLMTEGLQMVIEGAFGLSLDLYLKTVGDMALNNGVNLEGAKQFKTLLEALLRVKMNNK